MSTLTHIDRRLSLRPSDSYIIDPIFPNAAMHVISGPPDIGKTTWLYQILYDWERGKAVLGGCKSNPCDWVYVALDRSLRDADRTLRRLGMDSWNMPAYAIEEVIDRNASKKIDIEPSIFRIVDKFPKCELFVIEGLQMLLPNVGRGQSLNKAQGMWVIKLRDEILNKGITIIAVNHTPKSSDAAHDRENMLGSQGLIGGLGTTITFGLPADSSGKAQGMLGPSQTDQRLVTVMPKNTPRLYLTYSRGINGSFDLDSTSTTASDPDTSPNKLVEIYETMGDATRIFDAHLLAYEGQDELRASQVVKWAKDANIHPDKAKIWISLQVTSGRLVREGGGNLRRTSIQ